MDRHTQYLFTPKLIYVYPLVGFSTADETAENTFPATADHGSLGGTLPQWPHLGPIPSESLAVYDCLTKQVSSVGQCPLVRCPAYP